ncbi:MAG: hypothetical protein WCP60_09965 [bacterium]
MKISSFVLVVVLGVLTALHASDAPSDAQAESTKLLNAISGGDYAAFIADGSDAFKGITKTQFDAVVAQLSTEMKAGYEATYLGDLNQKGYQVTLWRLRFSSGGDDLLATLSLKGGKVGGYWIK